MTGNREMARIFSKAARRRMARDLSKIVHGHGAVPIIIVVAGNVPSEAWSVFWRENVTSACVEQKRGKTTTVEDDHGNRQ
jgi:hypothetical protein